jgi:galactokinase/mevalonate kinase-like predicted kinase
MVVASLNEVCEGVDLIDDAIHDPFRDVVQPLIDSGSAVAWKALGAGGGGCSAILCSSTGREEVIQAIEGAEWEIIDWDFEDKGVLLHD